MDFNKRVAESIAKQKQTKIKSSNQKTLNYDQPFKSSGKKRKAMSQEDETLNSSLFLEELQSKPFNSSDTITTTTTLKRRKKKGTNISTTKKTVSKIVNDVFIPKEILLNIFSYLDFYSIFCSILHTCKTWNRIFSEENFELVSELVWKKHSTYLSIPNRGSEKLREKLQKCYGTKLLKFETINCFDTTVFLAIQNVLNNSASDDSQEEFPAVTRLESICCSEPVQQLYAAYLPPSIINKLVNLSSVHIEYNSKLLDGLADVDCSIFPQITTLNIRNCNLSSNIWNKLISHLITVEELCIRDCAEIVDSAFSRLIANIGDPTLMKKLDLSGIKLVPATIERIAAAFSFTQELHLEGGKKGFAKLSKESLRGFFNLERLYLQNNTSFRSETSLLEMLLFCFADCKRLTLIHIEGCVNNFSESSLSKLFHKIPSIKEITVTQFPYTITYKENQIKYVTTTNETGPLRIFKGTNGNKLYI